MILGAPFRNYHDVKCIFTLLYIAKGCFGDREIFCFALFVVVTCKTKVVVVTWKALS